MLRPTRGTWCTRLRRPLPGFQLELGFGPCTPCEGDRNLCWVDPDWHPTAPHLWWLAYSLETVNPGFLPPLRCHPTTEQASPGGGVAGSGLFQLVHVQGNVAFLDLVHLWQLFLRDLPLAAFGGHSLPSDRRRVLPTDD